MNVSTITLMDSEGQNWLVRVYHDEGIRQLYTQKTQEQGQREVKINTLSGRIYKIKIGTNGQLYTYPVDSLG